MAFLAIQNERVAAKIRRTASVGSFARSLFLRGMLLLFVLCLSARPAMGQDAASYRIKAVFLYNFAQFTTWPESAFDGPKAPFVIGVLGKDPFGTALDATVKGEEIGGRPIEVRRYRTASEIKNCQILFISASEQDRINPIIDSLAKKPVLTVGETERFALNGGMIRFLAENNKIRFRINAEAAEKAGLTISSKLLRLAEIVKTERIRQ